MSFRGINDQDKENKLLLARFFWESDFIPFLEIPINQYMTGKKFGTDITDLDVLGWKYIPFVGQLTLTGSAKGKAENTSHKSEILKLKGLNTLFSPMNSFYLHDTSPVDELYSFAKDLGIEVLSKASFSTILTRQTPRIQLTGAGLSNLKIAIEVFKKYEIYEFIISQYWLSNDPNTFYMIETALSFCAEIINQIDIQTNFLAITYLVALFIIAIIRILNSVQNCSSLLSPLLES